MHNCFISVIALAQPGPELVTTFIKETHLVLKANFSDYEIILVNNRIGMDLVPVLKTLDRDVLKDVTVINLSRSINQDNAIVAGLDRANGDYSVILDLYFAANAGVIVDLYRKTQENFDIVYLRYKYRYIPFKKRIFYKLFHFIMKRYSILEIDPKMHSNRIISRRALNAILQYRETWRYMKGLYSCVGYNTSYIEMDIADNRDCMEKFSAQVSSAIKAITSFTDLSNRILLWLISLSVVFVSIVSINALFVKYLHHDVLGNPTQDVPGWTFLVILVSLGFAFQTFILYMMSIYLTGINDEIKRRPLYIIESFKRF